MLYQVVVVDDELDDTTEWEDAMTVEASSCLLLVVSSSRVLFIFDFS